MCAHLQGIGGALLAEGDLRKKHAHGGGGPGVALKYASTRINLCCNADHLHAARSCASRERFQNLLNLDPKNKTLSYAAAHLLLSV